MKKFINEFKEFIIQGDMVSLAIGVLIANSFSALVNSFTASFLTPIIEFGTNGIKFDELSFQIFGATFEYGKFINSFISFLITGFILFFIVKFYNKIKKATEKEKAIEEPTKPSVEDLLIEIRDELKK